MRMSSKKNYCSYACKIVAIGDHGAYTDIHHDFLAKYNISKTDAVLVRPDGHVAWYAKDEHEIKAYFEWLH